MTKELTNEEIVTRLLTTGEILKPSANTFNEQNSPSDLRAFLGRETSEIKSLPKGRFSFIDTESGWKWK